MPTGAERRTQQNLAIALALFEGKTDDRVAEAAGVSVRTVQNRKRTDEVQVEVQRLRFEHDAATLEAVSTSVRKAADEGVSALLETLPKAVAALAKLAFDSNVADGVRQKALSDLIAKGLDYQKLLTKGRLGEETEEGPWEPFEDALGHLRHREREQGGA